MSSNSIEKVSLPIRHKVLVLSGKGGVGKSTVAVNLATGLAQEGYRVGLLDVDVHGPSVPVLMGMSGARVETIGERMLPAKKNGVLVMSVGFMLSSQDDAVIWRGPMKTGVIKQFLQDVEWGELDYLIVDSPPGTGDEPLTIAQFLEDPQALIVTTPQQVAASDVRKSITFCNKIGIPVLGVVENMSGFVCPHCGEVTAIFRSGGGKKTADDFSVPFIGELPIAPEVGEAGDAGSPFFNAGSDSPVAVAFRHVVGRVLQLEGDAAPALSVVENKENDMRKIAVPVAAGKLDPHFGHCSAFRIFTVEGDDIKSDENIDAPPHEPGLLPVFLKEHGVTDIIAGGMGGRAQQLFVEKGIKVEVGAPVADAAELVRDYLAGTLEAGSNACDH